MSKQHPKRDLTDDEKTLMPLIIFFSVGGVIWFAFLIFAMLLEYTLQLFQ